MEFHGLDVRTQFKRMRELAPEAYRAFLDFDQKAFKDGAIPGQTKELIALGIHLRRHGHGLGRRLEPWRPHAAMPAGTQGAVEGLIERSRAWISR